MAYNITYKFNPKDTIWVLDEKNQSILEGECLQSNIVVSLGVNNAITTNITYIVLLSCGKGTETVKEEDTFDTLADALTALQTYIEQKTC